MRKRCNLFDAVYRHTVQVVSTFNSCAHRLTNSSGKMNNVSILSTTRIINHKYLLPWLLLIPSPYFIKVYPRLWSAILVPLDNKGMWNLRSAIWSRRYLGQELYIRVSNNEHSLYAEYDIPENAVLCGKANHP